MIVIMKKTLLVILFIMTGFGELFLSEKTNKNELFVFDSHTHIGLSIEGKQIKISDYKYYSNRNVNAIFFNLPVDRSYTPDLLRRTGEEIIKIKTLLDKNRSIKLAVSSDDYYDNYSKGINSIGLAIEYFKGIFNKNENTIPMYYKMGVRMICLMNNSYDRLFKKKNRIEKLNDLGRRIIKSMNKYRILIDITHLNDDQKFEVINFSKSPVIASHSNPREVAPSDFNVSDRVIMALREKQGLFLVSFNKGDLFPDKNKAGKGIKKVINHLNYLRKKMGVKHIGIGTDLQHAGKYVPDDLKGVESFIKIISELKGQ